MRSSQRSLSRRLRPWLDPGAGLLLSLGLGAASASRQGRVWPSVLERSVFLPYRLAVGWGPRSLLAQHRAGARLQERTRGELTTMRPCEATRENDRLRALLGFRRRGEFELLPRAGGGPRPRPLRRSAGRGGGRTRRGRAGDGGASPPEGLLGRVRTRDGRYARVECLTSLETAVSVHEPAHSRGGILKWDPVHGGLAIARRPFAVGLAAR